MIFEVAIYMVLTLISTVQRPDFLNITIVTIAILQLSDTQTLRRKNFRYLVVGLILSVIYDMIWFPIEWDDRSNQVNLSPTLDAEKDMDSVHSYIMYVSIASTLFRIVLIFTFWRASIDFRRTLKGKE